MFPPVATILFGVRTLSSLRLVRQMPVVGFRAQPESRMSSSQGL